ncbi:MAG: S53 family peptidase [Thermoplasmata archaeon]
MTGMNLKRSFFSIRTAQMLLVFATAVILLVPVFPSHTPVQIGNPTHYFIPNSESGASPKAKPIGPESPGQILSVMVSLQYRNQPELDSYLNSLQNPHSAVYHHYLTADQFQNLYSPSPNEYYRYAEYFMSRGFTVTTYSDRVSIGLSGSVGEFDSLFGTAIDLYKGESGTFYAPSTGISLPVYYGAISGVVGLSDQYRATLSPLFQGSGTSETMYGADFQNAYHLSSLYSKYGYPTNETVATILWSGTNSSGQSVGPYVPSDIQYYMNNNIPSNEPRANIYYYNFSGAPAPGPSAAYDSTGANVESTLDLEMAASLAPGASIVEVYGPQPTLTYLDQAFANILNPSYNTTVDSALKNVSVISNSWGTNDTSNPTWTQYEQEAAARGITVFASSGDNGNTPSPSPSFPASSAYSSYGTVAVGGTFTTLSGSPSANGSGTTGITTQSVWYNLPQAGKGTQGGVSSNYSEPSWQTDSPDASGVISSSSSVTGVSSGRGTPDISADGSNMTIYLSTSSGASYYTVDGTSIASPLTAAEFAVIDHSLGKNVGFVLPAIYRMGNAEYNGSYSSNPPFYFVYNGSNHDFTASKGYNLVTGWGSVNAYSFLRDYSNLGSTVVNFTESGLPSGTGWYVNVSGHNQSTTGSFITQTLPYGNYTYTVGNSLSYHEYPEAGKLDLNTPSQNITVYFSQKKYNVSFMETGLKAGTPWNVTFNGTQNSSDTSTVNFTSFIGKYNFSVGPLVYYMPVPETGNVTILNNNVSVSIVFDRVYNATFVSRGLQNGTVWGISLSGKIVKTDTSSLLVHLVNGTYKFSVLTLTGYEANMTNGSLTISGKGVYIYLGWFHVYNVTFNEVGIPAGITWGIRISGSTISTDNASITTRERNGTYTYYPYASSGYSPLNSSKNLSVSGSPVSVNVYFMNRFEYEVKFYEKGLPSGLQWVLYINGTRFSSNTSEIIDILPNGTYSYIVGIISGYQSTYPGGTFKVHGGGLTVNITFEAVITAANFVLENYSVQIPWHVIINGSKAGYFYSNNSSLAIPLPAGKYTYMVILGDSNSTPLASGSFVISGSSVTILVNLSYSSRQQSIDLIYGISMLSVGLVFVGIGILLSKRRK